MQNPLTFLKCSVLPSKEDVVEQLNMLALNSDEDFMNAANFVADLSVSRIGSPYRVGCLIVNCDRMIISVGWRRLIEIETDKGEVVERHEHAEIMATKHMTSLRGNDVFVTLEPCSLRSHNLPSCMSILKGLKPSRVIFEKKDSTHLTKTGVECETQAVLTQNGIKVIQMSFDGPDHD